MTNITLKRARVALAVALAAASSLSLAQTAAPTLPARSSRLSENSWSRAITRSVSSSLSS